MSRTPGYLSEGEQDTPVATLEQEDRREPSLTRVGPYPSGKNSEPECSPVVEHAERLQMLEEQCRILFEANPEPMLIYAKDSTAILNANAAATRCYGYDRPDFLKMRMGDLRVSSDDCTQTQTQTLEDTDITRHPRHRCKDGSIIYVKCVSHDVDYHGRPAAIALISDVTRRRKAEVDLEQERALLDTLLMNCPDRIYFKDSKSGFIRCSRAVAAPLGIEDPSDAIGKSDFDFFTEEHARPAFKDEQRIMETGDPVVGKVEKETWANGAITWALTTKVPFRDSRGRIVGTCGISKDITALKEAEAKLEGMHKQLVDTSRRAGMAEVATDILHNVGNVLNSVNVSVSLIRDLLRQRNTANLAQAAALLESHRDDMAEFLAQDPKGKVLPRYLSKAAEQLQSEQSQINEEVLSLAQNVEHVKEIVAMQQSYAKVAGIVETLNIGELLDDAVRLNAGALSRHGVEVVRHYDKVPPLAVDKHKVLQILFNLIRNAKYAMDDGGKKEKILTLTIQARGEGRVAMSVTDNGVGIPRENLTKIFSHGFTTRKEGHGFGLHSGALAAKEMEGSLSAISEGPGRGATFTLELPTQQ